MFPHTFSQQLDHKNCFFHLFQIKKCQVRLSNSLFHYSKKSLFIFLPRRLRQACPRLEGFVAVAAAAAAAVAVLAAPELF